MSNSVSSEARRSRGHVLVFLAGPLAAVFFYLAPLSGLTRDAHALAAILVWVVIYWITEPIPLPVTALLGTAFCVLMGLGSAKAIFASYGHPIIFLFLGSFLLAEAMAVHGVDQRLARWMLSLSCVRTRPSRILLAVGAATGAISMWISNTASAAMMLPMVLGVIATLRRDQALRGDHQAGLLLMLSYAATAGGVATIVGTPANLIGVGLIAQQTGATIGFATWLSFGLPLALVLLIAAWGLLRWLHHVPSVTVPAFAPPLPPVRRSWSRGEINACVAFGTAVFLWVAPGLLGLAAGPEHGLVTWTKEHLPNELVALLAAGLLFVLPTDARAGTFTLDWKQASNINWGIIILFGGGLAFGDLMVKTELSDSVGHGFISLFGSITVWSLTAVAIVAGVLISEMASNTAAASLLVPLVIAIAQADQISPLPPALGACLGASLGFALPVSTPPNAIVYGTSLVPMSSMIRAGVLFDLIGIVVVWLTLRIVCPLIGLV